MILAYGDNRLIAPGSGWLLLHFTSDQAVNRERIVLDLFSDVYSGASFFQETYAKREQNTEKKIDKEKIDEYKKMPNIEKRGSEKAK